MEFKPFPKIEKFGKAQMHITQKIHGTNAQVFIFKNTRVLGTVDTTMTEEQLKASLQYTGTNKLELAPYSDNSFTVIEHFTDILCGSRTRWITPEDDNYGFARHVYAHKEEFIEKLGVGQHFGEWAGPGINSGEGLTEKLFILFDHWKYPPERPLPPKTVVVPVLYQGQMDLSVIETVMNDLKTNGSKLVQGFMRPEGVVIQTLGTRYKKVFDAEETQWKKADEGYQKVKAENEKSESVKVQEQYGHLFQPIRLEKLLSRDEKYVRDFPKSLPQIATDYFADLVVEGQVTGSIEEVAGIRKFIGSELFRFVRTFTQQAKDNQVGVQNTTS